MYKGKHVTVVIPAHNEERHIGNVLSTMPDFVDRLIVVDDCSRDRTADSVLAAKDSRVLLRKTPSNQGVGGAVILGYRVALELGSDIVVKMDGDGQMPPECMPQLLDAAAQDGVDYAKGNRFLFGPALRQMPRKRLFGNIVLTFLTKAASGYWHLFDPQNGFTAITVGALRQLDLDSIHKRFFFENDILVHLNLLNCRVRDVPMPARYGNEVSDVSLVNSGLTFPVLLLRRYVRRIYQKYVLRDFSPIALFLFSGAVLFLWGVLFGAFVWVRSYTTQQLASTGTIMLALLPLILGFQLLLQGFVMDIQETPK